MKPTPPLFFICAAVASMTLNGCAVGPRSPSLGSSTLTAGMVKIEIIKGVTTQAEVLQIFGAPNIVTINTAEDEVWDYNRMSFESASSSAGVLGIFWGGWAAGGAGGHRASSTVTTKSFDLILIFDENDVVSDYTMIQAAY